LAPDVSEVASQDLRISAVFNEMNRAGKSSARSDMV
jgi:hypothetical protein